VVIENSAAGNDQATDIGQEIRKFVENNQAQQ